ncbi:MAG: hypothetical protein V3S70_06130 [Gammaproteobacteria bacterium]
MNDLELLDVDRIAEALGFQGTQRQRRRRVYALHEKDPNFPTIMVGGRVVARRPTLLRFVENLERAKLQRIERANAPLLSEGQE